VEHCQIVLTLKEGEMRRLAIGFAA
jgi:hypothetical protein